MNGAVDPWAAFNPQPAPQADARSQPDPWAAFNPVPAPEFTRTLNTVVDTPARAAPLPTQAAASLRTRTPEQIEVYARQLGIPRERFGTVDGQIVYRDDQGQLVRVSPSVTGMTGPIDALRRITGFVARNAGEIPAAAGGAVAATGAIVPPASMLTIPLAGALSAGGEVARQAVGDAVLGPRPEGYDWGNVAVQGGMGAAGQAAGLGAARLLERNPTGVVGSADRDFFRNPANVTATRQLAHDGQQEGVTLLAGDVTNRGSLLQRDRQLGRFPDTTDDMRNVFNRRNTVEVPTAVNNRITAATGGTPSVDAGGATFRNAAGEVIETAFERMQGLNSPLFQEAWAARPGVVWNDTLASLMDRPAVAQAWREAQVAAANSGRPLPEIFRVKPGGGLELAAEAVPDMPAWHMIKRSLDQIVNGGADPITGALRLPGGREVREARDALRGALVAENPQYGRALAESAPRLQAFADLQASGVARTANTTGDAANAGLSAVFDGSRIAPGRVEQYRQAFVDAGKEGEWRQGLAAYLTQALNDAQRVTQRGEPVNVAGKFYQNVFGTPQRREAIAVALGGEASPEFQAFARTMRVLEAAARSLPEGSPTATDIGGRAGFASGGANVAANTVRAVNPLNWPSAIGNFIENLSAGRNARNLAAGYAEGPANNAALIGRDVRLLPNPAVGLLGAGGQAAAFGAAGLLGAPADAVPPMPPAQAPVRSLLRP